MKGGGGGYRRAFTPQQLRTGVLDCTSKLYYRTRKGRKGNALDQQGVSEDKVKRNWTYQAVSFR